ncbi:hypothetical protein BH20CHL5_BH20CHL5_15060 [soil metagenome]|jgi:hypothetical protein
MPVPEPRTLLERLEDLLQGIRERLAPPAR